MTNNNNNEMTITTPAGRKFTASRAALESAAWLDVDIDQDIVDAINGKTKDVLLAECLEGAEEADRDDWEDYCESVRLAAYCESAAR